MKHISKYFLIALYILSLIVGCTTYRKINYIKRNSTEAMIVPSKDNDMAELSLRDTLRRDTLTVEGDDGKEILIMKAVKDENGEMVATDVIKAAKVTARFRNVAERHGKIDIGFQVIVPRTMLDSKWQLRFYPVLYILGDSTDLEHVIITGKGYRKEQLKGYQQYSKFLKSIISDTTKFINEFQLEIFIKRNIPAIYKYKQDSSYVSDEQFSSEYGVTQKDALEHYTKKFLIRRNDRKKANKHKIFEKYVKVPIVSEGIKLDTVIQNDDGDFIYDYIQTVNTRPGLRKADIVISGDIFETDKRIYSIPRSKPLTFYISSISAFLDNELRYKTIVVERRAEANTACYIDFKSAKAEIDESMGANHEEIGRIKSNLRSLIENKVYDMDSIVITASCSPEGNYGYNKRLAQLRSESVSAFFYKYIRQFRDSLTHEKGFNLSMDESYNGVEKNRTNAIKLIAKSNPENWEMLDFLVKRDTSLDDRQKEEIQELCKIPNPDLRENELRNNKSYKHLREKLYPRLRTVRFDFHLHRKNMVKDTLHTTVIDSAYMEGLQAIKDRDYKKAITLLRPYNDFNTAIAYCAMDYNASSMSILEKMDKTDKVNYLLAILYSRQGDERNAIQSYLRACKQNRSYIHRGNLDPEISALIKKYGLNEEEY
jgi:hypothetical protein